MQGSEWNPPERKNNKNFPIIHFEKEKGRREDNISLFLDFSIPLIFTFIDVNDVDFC